MIKTQPVPTVTLEESPNAGAKPGAQQEQGGSPSLFRFSRARLPGFKAVRSRDGCLEGRSRTVPGSPSESTEPSHLMIQVE